MMVMMRECQVSFPFADIKGEGQASSTGEPCRFMSVSFLSVITFFRSRFLLLTQTFSRVVLVADAFVFELNSVGRQRALVIAAQIESQEKLLITVSVRTHTNR